MSKERKLPGKDYFHNYNPADKKKRIHTRLSDEEKKGFREAFSDEDDGDVKTYTPPVAEKKTGTEETRSSGDDMYALPEFDADEFFSTLGIDINSNKKEASKPDSDAENIGRTQIINTEDPEKKAAEAPEKKDVSNTDTLSRTRHFSLRYMTKKIPVDKSRKSFMQNFRVLSKDKEDRAIIEAAPVGKGGRAFADSVKARKGEDIFEAVEKAYLEKDEITQIKIENTQLRKERNIKGAEKGAEIRKYAQSQIEKQKTKMIVYGVLFVLLMIMTLFFYEKRFYAVLGVVVSVALVVMNFSAFRRSFAAIKRFSAVPETALVVISFFVLVHNVAMLALNQPGSLYTVCAVFACFMRSFSYYFKLKNRVRMLLMAANSKSLSMLQRIPVKGETAPLAPNVENGEEPDIFYCAKAFLDSAVEEPDYDPAEEHKYYVFSMSLVLLSSLVVGLVCFATQLTGISFISAFTATVCAAFPIMYDPLNRYVFFSKGKDMLRQGACVSGREALQYIGTSDGFVLDAKDVFAADISRFRKSALSSIAQNDSAVFAAMLLNEAGSVLAPCFDNFMSKLNIKLSPVENFQYEERLGYSAWILDRKILVGNRQMLLNHSITVPSKEHERAYGKNRFVMYVAVDGEISATFLVNYKVLSSLVGYSRDFNKTGLVLMLSSKEAFLNEEIVSAKLSLDISSVKVLSSKATEVMDKFNSSIEEQIPTGLLCSRKKRSIMHLIMGCYNLNSADKLIRSLMVLGQFMSILILLLSPILKIPAFLNPIVIVILRLIWCEAVNLIVEHKK